MLEEGKERGKKRAFEGVLGVPKIVSGVAEKVLVLDPAVTSPSIHWCGYNYTDNFSV